MNSLRIKKLVTTLLTINVLQFLASLAIFIKVGVSTLNEINLYIYLSLGLMLFSSLITIFGLYFASRYRNDNLMESIKNLEDFNTKLRTQRHDYLNHFQVIYGLMDLEEYEEAKKYIEPVFKDILKVSKALKTAQPAINALLQAKIEAAEKKNIDLYLEIRSELKNIPIEPWNLCKVIANLIDNSITALSECDKEKKIYLDIGEDLNSYTFQVTNNGPKIPDNKLEEIFKQGFTTKKEAEHGMGLYIVSSIINQANGFIRVTSTTEKTSFYFEIPKLDNN